MRICYECGYHGPERTCPQDSLPTFDEGGDLTRVAPLALVGGIFAERYEVVRELGAGGMGSVYLARHRAMHQDVALKVLLPETGRDPQAIKRFFREARLSAQLNHPNTIRVYDFGASEDGRLYLAMEYLEGRTLREALFEDGPLDPARAIHIARQVCAALDAAHSAQMVHRDLKPDNVFLVTLRNTPEFVKVLDFGIAKSLSPAEDVDLTATGLIVGTPRYMSPEQVQGLLLDGRSDLYALGVLLFEMLSGATPFDGTTPLAMVVRHVNEPPPPLPERVDDRIIPYALRELVQWLLAKRPEERPQTAAEVDAALARIGAGGQLLSDEDRTLALPLRRPGAESPVPAEPRVQDHTTTSTAGPGRGRRIAFALVAVVVAGIAAAVIALSGQEPEATASPAVKAPPPLVAAPEAAVVEGVPPPVPADPHETLPVTVRVPDGSGVSELPSAVPSPAESATPPVEVAVDAPPARAAATAETAEAMAETEPAPAPTRPTTRPKKPAPKEPKDPAPSRIKVNYDL